MYVKIDMELYDKIFQFLSDERGKKRTKGSFSFS